MKLGLLSALLILFIAFKLAGIITWSWWWVMGPLWIPIALAIVFLLIFAWCGGDVDKILPKSRFG